MHSSLSELNISLITMILRWLRITTPILDSRNFDIQHSKTDMLISMCHATGADRYLSNEGSRTYVDEARMAEAGVQHCWQAFVHPIYPQTNAPFLSNLSVIDLLFNVGPDARDIVLASGQITSGQYKPLLARA